MTVDLKKLIEEVRVTAAKKTHYEDGETNGGYGYSPGDTGNFDDTHSQGCEDGEIWMARKVLPILDALEAQVVAPPAPEHEWQPGAQHCCTCDWSCNLLVHTKSSCKKLWDAHVGGVK